MNKYSHTRGIFSLTIKDYVNTFNNNDSDYLTNRDLLITQKKKKTPKLSFEISENKKSEIQDNFISIEENKEDTSNIPVTSKLEFYNELTNSPKNTKLKNSSPNNDKKTRQRQSETINGKMKN